MLLTLIRRELLDNLMTFRFAAAVFITLLLVVAATAVLIQDYERRLESYNTSLETHRQKLYKWQTYSPGMDRLYVDRPPNPLSLFNVGLDKRLGNKIQVSHSFVPALWDAEMDSSDNSFLNIFSSIDIVFIFEVVLSLLALIFAYDALAGERERGTLRLVLTASYPTRTYPACEVHQCDALPACAIADEFAPRRDSANDLHLNFLKHRGFSPHGWDRSLIAYVSLSVLPHRTPDFITNAPHQHRADAVNVCVGILGIGLSEYDSYHECSARPLRCTRRIRFQSNKADI